MLMQHVICKVTANFSYQINWSEKSIIFFLKILPRMEILW